MNSPIIFICPHCVVALRGTITLTGMRNAIPVCPSCGFSPDPTVVLETVFGMIDAAIARTEQSRQYYIDNGTGTAKNPMFAAAVSRITELLQFRYRLREELTAKRILTHIPEELERV